MDAEGIVDVPLPVPDGAHHRGAEIKGLQDLLQGLFRSSHLYTSHRLSGYSPDVVFSAMAATTVGLSSR